MFDFSKNCELFAFKRKMSPLSENAHFSTNSFFRRKCYLFKDFPIFQFELVRASNINVCSVLKVYKLKNKLVSPQPNCCLKSNCKTPKHGQSFGFNVFHHILIHTKHIIMIRSPKPPTNRKINQCFNTKR